MHPHTFDVGEAALLLAPVGQVKQLLLVVPSHVKQE